MENAMGLEIGHTSTYMTGGAFVFVWKELGPVFTHIEAKCLDEVRVGGPISVKLNDNKEMA